MAAFYLVFFNRCLISQGLFNDLVAALITLGQTISEYLASDFFFFLTTDVF